MLLNRGAWREIRQKSQAGAGHQKLGPRQRGLTLVLQVTGNLFAHMCQQSFALARLSSLEETLQAPLLLRDFWYHSRAWSVVLTQGLGRNANADVRGSRCHFSTRKNLHGHLRTTSSRPAGEQQPAKLHILHCEFSYFRKFNTKWQMNANYTSTAQLKPEMLSTGSFNNPSHSSSAYISKDLSLVPGDWQSLTDSPA